MSGLGQYLKYYKIGNGENVAFVVFEQHGWEDAWAYDGLELVNIADRVMFDISLSNIPSNWTLYVIPYANPDGITNGYTNNGPGRCTISSRVDMNRCFPSEFSPFYTSRNYTGSTPLGANEAVALKNLIENNKGVGQNVVLDIHGWLNITYGDSDIAKYFNNEFGFGHTSSFGTGYLTTWAKSIGAKSVLIELPYPSSSDDILNRDFSGKLSTALKNMMNNYVSIEGGEEVNESASINSSDGDVNVRSGPGTSYNVITKLPHGTNVTIIRKGVAIANGYSWDKIRIGELEGYIASYYLTILQPYTDYTVGNHIFTKNKVETTIPSTTLNAISTGEAEYLSRDLVEIYENMNRLEDIQTRLALLCDVGVILEDAHACLLNYYNCTGNYIHHADGYRMVYAATELLSKIDQIENEAITVAEQMKNNETQFNFALSTEDGLQLDGGYNIYGRPFNEAIYEYISSLEQLNWFMAFGYTRIAMSSNVEIIGDKTRMTLTYTMKDYYDWNKNDTRSLFSIITQQELWELHYSGLAKNFSQDASYVRVLEWPNGNPSQAVRITDYSN